jgi:hypothetical protein
MVLAIATAILLPFANAEQSGEQIVLRIDSSHNISGVMGDYVTVESIIKNNGTEAIKDINTYMSIVDIGNRMPIDLEDWSAQKCVYINIINPGESLRLDWKIHLITPGEYSLSIIAITPTSERAVISPVTHFEVKAKIVLNPNNSLIVAIGMPLIIVLLLLGVRYLHKKKEAKILITVK